MEPKHLLPHQQEPARLIQSLSSPPCTEPHPFYTAQVVPKDQSGSEAFVTVS
jgi:hypothetical protein